MCPCQHSSQNESRYKAFCNRVSELCGIINGYPHITVSGDRLAIHEHRHDKEKSISKTQVIEFDEAYFKGKDIYVFDDVVTTGASYAIFPNQLEIFGGNVLGGLFLGRTHYKYTNDMERQSTLKPILWLFRDIVQLQKTARTRLERN